jgi:hypothetical protein
MQLAAAGFVAWLVAVDGAALVVLAEKAAEVLRGDNTFGTSSGPTDLRQPTTLAVVPEHAGQGSMGRPDVRPLADVVRFAARAQRTHRSTEFLTALRCSP